MTPAPLTGLESHGGASEGLNEEWQQWKTREDQAWNFILCFVCGSRPWGAAAFHLSLFILLLNVLYVRRFPPPSSRTYQLHYNNIDNKWAQEYFQKPLSVNTICCAIYRCLKCWVKYNQALGKIWTKPSDWVVLTQLFVTAKKVGLNI